MILDRILEDARTALDERRRARPEPALRELAVRAPAIRSLAASLEAAPGMAVIAEVKRRSPSAGAIAAAVDPARQAGLYAGAGAAGISVLTDAEHFGGSLADLEAVRVAGLNVPLLRKDFLLDEYGLLEARVAGADAVLLIVRALRGAQLSEMLAAAGELGLEALVEVHDEAELERALGTNARLIGINNRDLTSFDTSLEATVRLAGEIPADRLVVSESAITTPDDVRTVRAAGARAVLVGTALMRSDDPARALRELAAA